MKKPFLLIINDLYYPLSGTNDWKGCFETEDEAETAAEKLLGFSREENALGEQATSWKVIDLREWTES